MPCSNRPLDAVIKAVYKLAVAVVKLGIVVLAVVPNGEDDQKSLDGESSN